MDPASAQATDPADTLTFPVAVTLEDQVALQMRCLATPAMREGRVRREALVVLLSPLYLASGLVLGVLAAWLEDRHRGSFLGALAQVMAGHTLAAVGAVLAMMALFLGVVMLQRRLVRPRLRRVFRRILRAHPDVDPADPRLTLRPQVTIDDDGITSRSSTATTQLRWKLLKRWEERDGRLFVLGDAMTGFGLSTAAAPPELLDRIRAALTARLGPPGASGG